MAWETPKTNWGQAGQTVPIADDFNRIEGNIQELQNTKETPAGAQAKANTAEANAKAYTDAHEQKAAPHSGHETPAGAQAKADAAAGAVQAELDAHKAATASAVSTVNNSLNNHISSIGTTANYGHVKTINDLTKASYVNGEALSAYQGKLLKDLVEEANPEPITYTGSVPAGETVTICTFDINKVRGLCIEHSLYLRGSKYDVLRPNRLVGWYYDNSENEPFNVELISTDKSITHGTIGQQFMVQAKIIGSIVTLTGIGRSSNSSGYTIHVY
jgi:hypothetical protein